MKRFNGNVALVTGGNSGIGLAAAKAFAREGAAVVITGRDEASLKAAERELGAGAMALRADSSRMADLDSVMSRIRDRFKKIDALFVNAGIGKFVPFDQVTEAFFDETVAVNLKGVFFTVHKALRHDPLGPARCRFWVPSNDYRMPTVVIDGPFPETKELVAGYTLIQAKSREEAIEWTKRFPNPAIGGKEGEIEVRQLFELEDFGPSEAVDRFREMGVGTKK